VTNESETGQDQLAARRLLTGETRRALDEVAHHSLGRTGEVAHAIEAGLVVLRDDAVLAPGHREALEEFACMVSESTPSANGTGIGMRCVRWRDALHALLGALPPDPLRELFAKLAASLTPQQAERLDRPFGLDPGEACWCNLGKDCTGDHEVYIGELVHRCGFCGQTFRIATDDPHWSTGRGPICPTSSLGRRPC
jgi:hypothetical protein